MQAPTGGVDKPVATAKATRMAVAVCEGSSATAMSVTRSDPSARKEHEAFDPGDRRFAQERTTDACRTRPSSALSWSAPKEPVRLRV